MHTAGQEKRPAGPRFRSQRAVSQVVAGVGSGRPRLSRRFYRPLLPARVHASELRKHRPITLRIRRCPLTCIAAVPQWFAMGRLPFSGVLHLLPCPDCCRFLRAGGRVRGREPPGAAPKAPLTRPPGSGSWPAGGKGANLRRVRRFRVCWRGAFLAGTGVTCSMTGRGRRGDSQAYLGPRALCRARRHDDRLGVLPPAGGCGLRPSAWPCAAGPGAADSGLAGAGRGYAPSGEFGSGSPARPAASGWATMGDGCRAQAAVSASSPSSVRIWQAWRRILRASERAARLPPLRSLTAA